MVSRVLVALALVLGLATTRVAIADAPSAGAAALVELAADGDEPAAVLPDLPSAAPPRPVAVTSEPIVLPPRERPATELLRPPRKASR